jgi:Flp pilus assembly protein TadB
MSKEEDELQRLIRLRNQQVQTRDPQARARELHGRLSKRQRKRQRHFGMRAIGEEIRAISNKWKGAVIGGALGFVALIVLTAFIEPAAAVPIGLVAIVVLAVVGFIFGTSFDWRDEISELGKG